MSSLERHSPSLSSPRAPVSWSRRARVLIPVITILRMRSLTPVPTGNSGTVLFLDRRFVDDRQTPHYRNSVPVRSRLESTESIPPGKQNGTQCGFNTKTCVTANGSRPCAGPFTQEANRLQPSG